MLDRAVLTMGIMVGFMVATVIFVCGYDYVWERKAIEAKVGRYHPETGKFEFIWKHEVYIKVLVLFSSY